METGRRGRSNVYQPPASWWPNPAAAYCYSERTRETEEGKGSPAMAWPDFAGVAGARRGRKIGERRCGCSLFKRVTDVNELGFSTLKIYDVLLQICVYFIVLYCIVL